MADTAPVGAEEEEEQPGVVVTMHVNDIKNFTNLVSLLRWSNKQVAVARVDSAGLTLTATDDSKGLQGVLHFKRDYFSHYHFAPLGHRLFGVTMGSLVDTLGVFAASDGLGELVVTWPNADACVAFELTHLSDDEHRPIRTCMYCQLGCEEADRPTDHAAAMVAPCSEILIWTTALKEAVDDLEWPGAAVKVSIKRKPDMVSFASTGTEVGSLEIEMKLERAHGGQILQCIGSGVSHRYKYKHLKLTTNIVGAVLHPGAARAGAAPSTKMMIDEHGLMKISHHLKAAGAQDGPQADAALPNRDTVTVTAHFMLSPEDEIYDSADDDASDARL